ncbi:hypothetical protein CYMTET_25312 [Cymbomonas tetramitiformis]|uniref:Uncharacterized protein n=1 Tax=Cymbomonas tetramitiformis TaxID=36881 RepID=A0AAE0KZ27_9CHLO|nr:hypothetical protein CYMTET_25312 [Cymbomonas tetramitiformis]
MQDACLAVELCAVKDISASSRVSGTMSVGGTTQKLPGVNCVNGRATWTGILPPRLQEIDLSTWIEVELKQEMDGAPKSNHLGRILGKATFSIKALLEVPANCLQHLDLPVPPEACAAVAQECEATFSIRVTVVSGRP